MFRVIDAETENEAARPPILPKMNISSRGGDWLQAMNSDCGLVGRWKDLGEWPGSRTNIVQELCESRGGRPGLSVLTSLLVSVDVKNY